MRVSALYRFPVKSCRGIACRNLELGPNGPFHDRAFMLVKADDPLQFVTQRTDPRLALVSPWFIGERLLLSAPRMSNLVIPDDPKNAGERVETKVHNEPCIGVDQGPETAQWFSDLLERAVRLLYMPEDYTRVPGRLPPDVRAGLRFADSYPLLLTSVASLRGLNAALPRNVPPFSMDRFRPNIVVEDEKSHMGAWAEERWRRFACGDLVLHGMKPCRRCQIIGVDQVTGERTEDLVDALLAIHSGERKGKQYPLFGMYLLPEKLGVIRLGDQISNIEFGPRPEL